MAEHKEFVNFLRRLGIPFSMFRFQLKDSSNRSYETLNQLALEFEKEIGKHPRVYQGYSKRGGYGFKTIVGSTVLTHVVLSLLHNFRKKISENNQSLEGLSNTFLAKLLTGDGSISINKKNVSGNVRIRIYDENRGYLEDYKKIMKNVGFNYIRNDDKHNAVEANCTLDNLLYLYKIQAFKNTNNWNKLLVIIGFYLEGKRVKIRLRLLDLSGKTFTSRYIAKTYSLHPEDRKWLNNMIKKGFFMRLNGKPPFEHVLTEKSKDFISTIESWKVDLNNLMISKGTRDLFRLWNTIKRSPLTK